jgi:ligand-binding sensor domain-containing protein
VDTRSPPLAVVLLCCASAAFPQVAPATRQWRPEERALLTDLSYVTAVAATQNVVYAATPFGLGVYDRGFSRWRETVGPLEGYPAGPITAMAADPSDDTAWLAGQGTWLAWQPFTRQWTSGVLPGTADQVVLDAANPSAGAYFHTTAGWFVVARGSFTAVAARPPAGRLGALTALDVQRRLPAFDAIRLRIEQDEFLRPYRVTSATSVPVTNEVILGTSGNGTFSVDPVGYATAHLPMGLLGGAAGAIAAWRGQVCAATDARIAAQRRGIACFEEDAGDLSVVEGTHGVPSLPGTAVHALLVTERAVWCATNAGLVRSDRRRGQLLRLDARDALPSDDARALAPAGTGVWVGTSRGVALVPDTGRALLVAQTVEGDAVLSLLVFRDTLFVGTVSGLFALPPLGDRLFAVSGPGPLREPIVALAARGDTVLAATESRFVVRVGGEWRVLEPPGARIGRVTGLAADPAGYWVSGTQGLAFYDPSRAVWNALVSPGDVPMPVSGVAVSRSYVWAATPIGVVRYERRVLLP